MQARGDLAGALSAYREYLDDHPGAAGVWHAAAGCAFALQDHDSAAHALERAVAAAPDNTEYLADLGGLYLQLGKALAAEQMLARAVALAPNAVNSLYNYCNALFANHKVADAVRQLQHLVAIEPRLVDAHFNLGVAYRSLDQSFAARQALAKVLALEPGHARAHLELAGLNRAAGSIERSLPHYECYLRANPRDVTISAHFALACYENGEFDRALDLMQDARSRCGPHSVITGVTGRLLINRGRMAEAENLFRRDFELEHTRIIAARGLAEVLKTEDEAAPYIAVLREAASDPGASPESTIGVLFALGKVHDDLGAYADAFEYFREANRRRGQTRYDRADREARTETLIGFFTRDRIAALQATGSPTELPIFVVGMPRSGTTLVEQIIAAHPVAHGAGELKYFSQIPDALPEMAAKRQPYPRVLEDLSVLQRKEITADYLALLRRHSATALRIVDKLPGNYLQLGLILSLMPNCRVVHCRRDPADVCLSTYFQNFEQPPAYASNFDDIAHAYAEQERIMDYWHSRFPHQILAVDYSELVVSFEAEARRLIAHCALDWDPACLSFHLTETNVRTASSTQVRRPVYRTSVQRWRHYAEYLPDSIIALSEQFRSRPAHAR